MLADAGARYVIIGHSERRHTISHHEDDRMINLKLRAACQAGLTPILCVGETLAEREAGQTMDVLTFQLTAALVGVQPKTSEDLVIAYEPVWAIGTGHNATPEQAQEAHAHLRGQLAQRGGNLANEIRILYGGSMKPENAGDLLTQPDVDGGPDRWSQSKGRGVPGNHSGGSGISAVNMLCLWDSAESGARQRADNHS